MKLNIIISLALVISFVALPSCSPTKKMTTVSVAAPKEAAKKSSSKKTTAVYDDSELDTPVATSDNNFKPELIGGEWTVYTVKGKKVSGETRPYLNFNLGDCRLYGSNGCNIVNASFRITQPDTLTFSDVLTTMMACPDADYEQAINEAINATRHYKITRQGHEYYLELSNAQHRQLMTLRKHNMDFLNGPWMVSEIEGDKIDNPDVQMVIDIPEKSIHGHTGCNILNGELLIDPDKSHSIQFSNIGVSRMMCPDDVTKIETAFLVALEKVESAHKGKDSTIILSDKNDDPVIILTKIIDKQP